MVVRMFVTKFASFSNMLLMDVSTFASLVSQCCPPGQPLSFQGWQFGSIVCLLKSCGAKFPDRIHVPFRFYFGFVFLKDVFKLARFAEQVEVSIDRFDFLLCVCLHCNA